MRDRTLSLAAVLVALVALVGAACSSASKSASAASQMAPASAAAPAAEQTVDGDAAYKANCTRCHQEMPKVSDRATATVMQHMRVRANLTSAEAKAILGYLTQ